MSVVTITQPRDYKAGSTWVFVLTRKQPDETPVDLTGLTIRSTFRRDSVSGESVAALTASNGIAIDAAQGRVTLTIEAAVSATVAAAIWVFFDVEMTSASGYVWQSPTYRFKTEAQVT